MFLLHHLQYERILVVGHLQRCRFSCFVDQETEYSTLWFPGLRQREKQSELELQWRQELWNHKRMSEKTDWNVVTILIHAQFAALLSPCISFTGVHQLACQWKGSLNVIHPNKICVKRWQLLRQISPLFWWRPMLNTCAAHLIQCDTVIRKGAENLSECISVIGVKRVWRSKLGWRTGREYDRFNLNCRNQQQMTVFLCICQARSEQATARLGKREGERTSHSRLFWSTE